MRPRRFLVLAIMAIGVIFFALNSVSANLLSGLRIDATHDRLYTLSTGTKAMINGLDERVTLDFYAARDALSDDPLLRTYAARVRDLLKAYAALSNGKIVLNEFDPAPFSKAEDAALAMGLRGVSSSDPDAPALYLGLVVKNVVDNKQVIPLFQPEQEASLEYNITRAISATLNPAKPRIAVVSSLPWLFSPERDDTAYQPVAKVAADLAAAYDVAFLGSDFDQLPPNTQMVLLAQPPELGLYQLYLLDQFALNQGRIMVLLDPASAVAKDGGGGEVSATQSLGPLAQAWGFSVQGDVILDRQGALPVQALIDGRQVVAPQPLYFSIPKSGLNQTNLVTSGLGRGLHMGTAGEIVSTQTNGLTFEPLITTSNDTMRMDPVRALSGLNPQAIALEWESSGASITIGAALRGRLSTAFPNGPPPAPIRSPQQEAVFGPRPTPAPHLATGRSDAQILVIGDVDLLAESFYLTPQGDAADNAAFILNAIDILAGSDALVGLRSRTPSARPLVVVERLKAAAQARLLEEQQGLQTRLETATARLEELEAKGSGAGFFSDQTESALSSVEQRELDRFRGEILETRKRLRRVQEGVNASVGQIKTMLILLSAFLVPLLVALVGVWVFIARRMAARQARRTPVLEQIEAELEALS